MFLRCWKREKKKQCKGQEKWISQPQRGILNATIAAIKNKILLGIGFQNAFTTTVLKSKKSFIVNIMILALLFSKSQ